MYRGKVVDRIVVNFGALFISVAKQRWKLSKEKNSRNVTVEGDARYFGGNFEFSFLWVPPMDPSNDVDSRETIRKFTREMLMPIGDIPVREIGLKLSCYESIAASVSHSLKTSSLSVEDEALYNGYLTALKHYHKHVAVVPFVSERIKSLGQEVCESRAILQRQHLIIVGIVFLWILTAVLCIGITWGMHQRHERQVNATLTSLIITMQHLVLSQPPRTTETCQLSPEVMETITTLASGANIPPQPIPVPVPKDLIEDSYLPKFPLLLGAATPYAGSCTPLDPKATIEDVGFSVTDLRNTMRHYLSSSAKTERKLSYLSAVHVGRPMCYSIVNTDYSRAIKYRNDDALIEMFNPRIVGYSHEQLVQSRERHHECERSGIYIRYETVWVRYEDATGKSLERRFDGPLAYELQHIAELHLGKFRCYDEIRDAIASAVENTLGRNVAPYRGEQVRWELPATSTTTGTAELPDDER